MIDKRDLTHVFEHTHALWENLRGERIFITGGTGFVGSWLLASFAYANRELRLRAQAVVLTRDPAAAALRLAQLDADSAIVPVAGDGTDFVFPPGRFAFVVHAATARAFVPSVTRPLGIIEADALTTRRVLEFARGARTARMLFTSSGAVYGPQPADVRALAEDGTSAPSTTDAGAAYGHSKRYSEVLCAMYAHACDLHVTIARLFAFVGPLLPLDEGYAVGNFISDALAGRPIRVEGDGTPIRSYLYAADLAVWLWTILFSGRLGRAYNVGATDGLSIGELAHLVAQISGTAAVDFARLPRLGAAPSRYVPDTARAQSELSLHAFIPVREGVRRTLRFHAKRSLRAAGSRSHW